MTSRWTPGHISPITLHLVGPRSWTEVPALLCYDPTDPYAVRIAFGDADDQDGGADGEEGIAWLVSRELLQAGLEHPAGDGDVRVWPARATADLLYLHLRAPSGEALFELSRATVAAFLRHTEALVPPGSEGELLQLDQELDALLSNGGPDSPGR
ncbi:Streptomyces sporulation and cell division protein, SsgA [Blastococcus sp. DSM 46786]|uniref:SsgA family sporulation/cell division regulator n=1 Tax=Blastococcus sp. DSM 46786 TaxID=1798227 RepID=UPI0008D88C71|nr:SsgA family sporulation/cell division regulator [Blastococcus sp. DSM 46786]SEL43158.1 Streptomyces sporulation and cell division protein, SsgA [Blastococcus sp. DSM 46786]